MVPSKEFEGDSGGVEQLSPRKTVRFADSLGHELTSTYFFPNEIRVESASLQSLPLGLQNGKPATKILNFRPARDESELVKEVEESKVCLEEFACRDSNVWGKIRVWNVAFEKNVTVRYTIDSWKTYKETAASYDYGSITGRTDTFAFHISFPQSNDGGDKTKRLDFAVCYEVDEREFWDNNHGDNYRVVYA